MHLLGGLLELDGVDPLVVARVTDVVEVVVDTRAAGAFSLVGQREAANVAPVVVGPEEGNVLGDMEALFLVGLDFLVETPGLRDGGYVNLECVFDDGSLIGDKLFEHLQKGAEAKATLDLGIASSSHRHGEQAILGIGLGTKSTDTEVIIDRLVVEVVSPRALVVSPELVLTTHERLGVGRAEDNFVGIGERLVLGIISVVDGSPESGPEVVGAETEKQLADETPEFVCVTSRAVPGIGEVGAVI